MTMLSTNRRRLQWRVFSLALLVCVGAGIRIVIQSSAHGLPYRDSFAQGRTAEWKAFGGAWGLQDNVMQNNSDELGAKLITGSRDWKNYSIEADVMLLAPDGDAGLVIRSQDEEVGTDAYSGYYVGLRILQNSLVLGRAGHGWVEKTLPVEPGKIQIGRWYHIKLLAYNCEIVASESVLPAGPTDVISVTDNSCVASGRAGLRSFRSGGTWRHLLIKSATLNDLHVMEGLNLNGGVSISGHLSSHDFVGFYGSMPRPDLYTNEERPHIETIGSLRVDFSPTPRNVTVRGSIILTSPTLYVQESTGGVAVSQRLASTSLRIGDQVEVSGQPNVGNFGASLDNAVVRTLWSDTPIAPGAVSAAQAATGAYDATLIEVEGTLIRKGIAAKNEFTLGFASGNQSFSAVLHRGSGDGILEKLKPGSLLRVRGVCVIDPLFTKGQTPFTLLLRSSDDIDVLQGPPLWSFSHAAFLVIGLLLLALISNFLYHRVERWRLEAILIERERMAHEIHDTLAQSVAGIGFQLEAIRVSVPMDMSVVHQQLDLATELVHRSHKEARESIAALRPAIDESDDLLAELAKSARRLVEGGRVDIVATSSGEAIHLPLYVKDTIYRIGQEALTNSVRHSHPSRLLIKLDFCKNHVCLSISDDGCGFTPGRAIGNFGIRGMQKRAARIAAKLHIESRTGAGCEVRLVATLPPRLTVRMMPQLTWGWLREHVLYVKPTTQAN